jgi:hypothetical protein
VFGAVREADDTNCATTLTSSQNVFLVNAAFLTCGTFDSWMSFTPIISSKKRKEFTQEIIVSKKEILDALE